MKKLIILLSIFFASCSAFAGKPTDRHFYVTFTYRDCCGMLRIGSVGVTCSAGYPKASDMIIKAADAANVSAKKVQITGISSICAADYNNLFNAK